LLVRYAHNPNSKSKNFLLPKLIIGNILFRRGGNTVGRLSQLFWVLQAEEIPTPVETRHHYTHLNMATPTRRKEMAKLRREYRKSSALEDAAVLKGK